jgi:hypothetical protein
LCLTLNVLRAAIESLVVFVLWRVTLSVPTNIYCKVFDSIATDQVDCLAKENDLDLQNDSRCQLGYAFLPRDIFSLVWCGCSKQADV